MDGKDRDLVELASWALDRIASSEYEEIRDSAGNIQELELVKDPYLRERKIDPEQVEETLKRYLPTNQLNALLELKEHSTPQQLENVLGMLFQPSVASIGLEELREASWPEILLFIDRQKMESPSLAETFLRMVVKEREGFSSPAGKEIERLIENDNPAGMRDYTARTYLAEVGSLLPRMVKRAEKLKLLPSSTTIPDKLDRYMVEASRCYIYGQFLATLILCRSAIEEGLEDQLKSRGLSSELDKFQESRSMVTLINSARDKGILDETLSCLAHEVRKLAGDVVHGHRVPTDRECVQKFMSTRFILQTLYE